MNQKNVDLVLRMVKLFAQTISLLFVVIYAGYLNRPAGHDYFLWIAVAYCVLDSAILATGINWNMLGLLIDCVVRITVLSLYYYFLPNLQTLDLICGFLMVMPPFFINVGACCYFWYLSTDKLELPEVQPLEYTPFL